MHSWLNVVGWQALEDHPIAAWLLRRILVGSLRLYVGCREGGQHSSGRIGK